MTEEQDKIAKEIGYLVFEFNNLEDTIDYLIHALTRSKSEDITKILTKNDHFRKKLNKFKEISNYMLWVIDKEEKKNELSELVGDIIQVQSIRNDVVHGAWIEYFYTEDSENVRNKYKIKDGQVTEQTFKPSHETINETAKRIEELDEKLFYFYEDNFT